MTQLEKRQLRRIRRYMELVRESFDTLELSAGEEVWGAEPVNWPHLSAVAATGIEHLVWIQDTIRNTIQELPPIE